MPPVFTFAGYSNAGKTTFVESLVKVLVGRGLRLLVVKHGHHDFELDYPGKDTWRFREAGAERVIIANPRRLALQTTLRGAPNLDDLAERYGNGMDLVLAEGWLGYGGNKILVSRAGGPPPPPPEDPVWGELLGVVTDHALPTTLPHLPLDDAEACADFLLNDLMPARTPRRVTGALMVGGHGKRMGMDKAWLRFRGSLLLPRLVRRLLAECEGGVLVVRRAGQDLPELPKTERVRVVDDLLPDKGPLGGLYTALVHAHTPWIFAAACDMPLLDLDVISWQLQFPAPGADALVPVYDGKDQPMHGLYGSGVLGPLKSALVEDRLRVGEWLDSIRLRRLAEANWRRVHVTGQSFVNVNSPEDMLRAEALVVDGLETTDWLQDTEAEDTLDWQG